MPKKLALLILCLSFCFFTGCAVNPITGEGELMFFPEEQDIAIGRKYAPEVEKQMGGRIANQSLQNYIDSVGQRIARFSHRPDFEYHFVALNDKSVNAMALPGGYLFITKGMLKELATEAQLAGILAHEIVHIVARDTSNAMSNQIGIDILLSAVTSEKTSKGILTAADLTRQILGLQYSREDEKAADVAGMDYMVLAGYNPYGMVETMQMLKGRQEIRPIEFFSTHPSPKNRIAYLAQRIQTKHHTLEASRIGREDYYTAVLQQLND
ncbi:MAG: M48 family metalloprotease [Planctomycetota bacterium]|jgi:predicted Zn-dependent protease